MQDVLASLVGIDLSKFTLKPMYEVYDTNDDGNYSKSVCVIRSQELAEAFMDTRTNEIGVRRLRSHLVYVLTDGETGYILTVGQMCEVNMDDVITEEVRALVLKRITPAQRKVLGM